MLVKRMGKFLSGLFQALLKLENLEDLSVPLGLQELEHAREAHGLERFGCGMARDF